MRNLQSTFAALAADDLPGILLTVTSVRGSAPREVGARMIVTAKESIGTIGGGQLEYQCTQLAVEQLRKSSITAVDTATRKFVLGANCGQCCGGVVEVMFESLAAHGSGSWIAALETMYAARGSIVLTTRRNGPPQTYLISKEDVQGFGVNRKCPVSVLDAAREMLSHRGTTECIGDYFLQHIVETDFHVAVFGAGHVGAAVVDVMSRLDCHIHWVDSRMNVFPASVPKNVDIINCTNPEAEVASLPASAYFLVMTHSHPMDQEICQQVLARRDFAYCGLIGSVSKRRRFERRMQQQGMSRSLLDRLVCPIGVSGIDGRQPAVIAVSVAAELLQLHSRRAGKEDASHVLREASA